MSKAKDEILHRIQSALKEVPADEKREDVAVNREYIQKGNLSGEELVTLFVERSGEYQATVKRIKKEELKDEISKACDRHKAIKMVIPAGFKTDWLPDLLEPQFDDSGAPLSHDELDQLDGVISTCALAVAQTGTIILDAGAGQGRRVLSLLPDYHLCIVREDQIVETVPEGFAGVSDQVKKEGRPITFISGPSATSDIELNRVEGVHGPRKLDILVVGG
ncbi:LutC/YkgG family protein [Gracilimonas mengyeensis]|uniref:L-lactate dehydrogenase complex protein LldG n=1 Tax=Gracilimonas mengyeensis TaxID=1302730 RepID=A0A521C415_9BACT|nr:lactate utilization protein C [Gracilimonas mengyeensis]SMO54182.1 L-lactate dehydrogenase complex protein LldG [Gracilimonas mengyeensis]